MTADGLRPKAECAARFAAAAGINGNVGVLQIADEVVFDVEITFVDRRNERQEVHVFQCRPLVVMDDHAVTIMVG